MKMLRFLNVLREEDHRRALYACMIFIMLNTLFFLLVSMEEPDPPLEEKIMPVELTEMEIPIEYIDSEEPGGGGSQGGPSPIDQQVHNSAAYIPTQAEHSVNIPSGNENGTQNGVNNQPQPDHSLGFNGNGGDGNGNGTGTGFGDGDGTGVGDGNGPGGYGNSNPNRKMVSEPDFNANVQEEGKIALDIWVDENGSVVQVRYKEAKSTSGSEYLISLATRAAKTIKFEKKPGAVKEYVGYQIFAFKKV